MPTNSRVPPGSFWCVTHPPIQLGVNVYNSLYDNFGNVLMLFSSLFRSQNVRAAFLLQFFLRVCAVICVNFFVITTNYHFLYFLCNYNNIIYTVDIIISLYLLHYDTMHWFQLIMRCLICAIVHAQSTMTILIS